MCMALVHRPFSCQILYTHITNKGCIYSSMQHAFRLQVLNFPSTALRILSCGIILISVNSSVVRTLNLGKLSSTNSNASSITREKTTIDSGEIKITF